MHELLFRVRRSLISQDIRFHHLPLNRLLDGHQVAFREAVPGQAAQRLDDLLQPLLLLVLQRRAENFSSGCAVRKSTTALPRLSAMVLFLLGHSAMAFSSASRASE